MPFVCVFVFSFSSFLVKSFSIVHFVVFMYLLLLPLLLPFAVNKSL